MAPEFVIAAPPDWKTTVGFVFITSLAAKLKIISWPTFAWVVGPGVLFDARDTPLSVGVVLSNVTLLELVTEATVAAFPERSVATTLKVIAPCVSLALVVYAAVQLDPLPPYVMAPEFVMGAPPEENITTGWTIVSLAAMVSVTTLPTLAKLDVELLEAMPTVDSVGTVRSIVTLPLPLVTGVPELSARSLKLIVYATAPPVSPAITVYFAVWIVLAGLEE
jgi:hypothetical protein